MTHLVCQNINLQKLCVVVLKYELIVSTSCIFNNAVAIRTGTVRRVWFAIRTAMGIFLAIVGEILVFFDFYNITLVKQQ